MNVREIISKQEHALRLQSVNSDRAPPLIFAAPEEGYILIQAFSRIRSPAIREALIELTSRLANDASN